MSERDLVPDGLCRCCYLNAGEEIPADGGGGLCLDCRECCQP